jgi:tRNA1(Val) A37 N6-methylase TrmN6
MPTPLDDLTEDALLGGRVRLAQPRDGFRAAIDPVLLAAFVPARPGQRVLELGCGTGAAFLCLAARVPGLTVEAVERDPALATLARANAGRNGVAALIHAEDLRAMPALEPVAHAFANPPYWPAGTASPHAARRQAAHEDAPLADWVRAMAGAVRPGGTVSLVLPAARWDEAAAVLRAAGIGALRLLPLWPRLGAAARRILVGGRRGGRSPAELLPGLVLHEGTGFSAAAEAVLRGGAALHEMDGA